MKNKTEQEIKQEMEDFSSAVQRFREAQRNALSGGESSVNQTDETVDHSGDAENEQA